MSDVVAESLKETQSRITPYAFSVAPAVLDTPLAKPWRRCTAIIADLALIGLASQFISEDTGALLLLTIWLMHRYLPAAYFKRIGATIIALLFITSIGYSLFTEAQPPVKGSGEITSMEVLDIVQVLPEVIALEQCQNNECTKDAITQLRAAAIEEEIAPVLIDEIIAETTGIRTPSRPSPIASEHPQSEDSSTVAIAESPEELADEYAENQSTNRGKEEVAEKYSPLSWLKGALSDLGMRFSWAAIYFTVFTAWFNGKTPGKRLLNIRVLRLDGKPITLWSAFGRYGGYGAGLATGLLGFLQIYWDPNRQAIQDKISTTAVVRER